MVVEIMIEAVVEAFPFIILGFGFYYGAKLVDMFIDRFWLEEKKNEYI